MSAAWPTAAMGEIAPLVRRPIQPLPDEVYREIGVRSFGKGIFHKAPTTGLEIGSKRVFSIEPGDLLFNIVFAWEGAVAVASEAERGMIGSHRFLTCVVDKSRADAKFLNYWFSRGEGRDKLLWASPGGAGRNRTLGIEKLAAIHVPLPLLDEQRHIVARIENLAAKIHEAQSLRKLALLQIQSLILQHLAEVFASEAPQVHLGDEAICAIVCGQHLSPDEQASDGIPYITGPADFSNRTAMPSRFALSPRACSEAGDVLLTVKGAGVGKANLAPDARTAIGRQLFALRPNPDRLDSLYLWYVIQYRLRHFREAITATTVPGIGRDDVECLKIPLPDLVGQRLIVAEIECLQTKIDALKVLQNETASELGAMLPAALDKAFNGEL
jgi:type I restriction enzyme, S subunit